VVPWRPAGVPRGPDQPRPPAPELAPDQHRVGGRPAAQKGLAVQEKAVNRPTHLLQNRSFLPIPLSHLSVTLSEPSSRVLSSIQRLAPAVQRQPIQNLARGRLRAARCPRPPCRPKLGITSLVGPEACRGLGAAPHHTKRARLDSTHALLARRIPLLPHIRPITPNAPVSTPVPRDYYISYRTLPLTLSTSTTFTVAHPPDKHTRPCRWPGHYPQGQQTPTRHRRDAYQAPAVNTQPRPRGTRVPMPSIMHAAFFSSPTSNILSSSLTSVAMSRSDSSMSSAGGSSRRPSVTSPSWITSPYRSCLQNASEVTEPSSYISDDDLLCLSDHDDVAAAPEPPRELTTEEQVELLRQMRQREDAAAGWCGGPDRADAWWRLQPPPQHLPAPLHQQKRTRMVRFAGETGRLSQGSGSRRRSSAQRGPLLQRKF